MNDSQRNAFFGYAGVVSPDDPRAIPPDLVVDEPSAPIVLGPGQSSVNVRGDSERTVQFRFREGEAG